MKHDQLRALLAEHVAWDAHEAAALAQVKALLTTSGTAWSGLWSRETVAPGHFTTSAVVVSEDGEDVLLIHHAAFGLWLQPGGHVDPGDASPMAAAMRELEEETSLRQADVTPLGLVDIDVHDVPDGIKGQAAHKHYDLRFAFRARTRAVAARSDAKDARWFSRSQVVKEGAVDTDGSVRAAVRRLKRLA